MAPMLSSPARKVCGKSLAYSRLILADSRVMSTRRQVGCNAVKCPVMPAAMPALLSSVLGASLLFPGASYAVQEITDGSEQQAVSIEAPIYTQDSHQFAASVAEAPGLTNVAGELACETDSASESACHRDNPIVTGIEWMVEEGREVTNFAENNFAAVGAPSSSMWLSNSPWCLVWDAYCNVLTTRPVATKLATGMVGTFLGDLVAQVMQGLLGSHSKKAAAGRSRSSGQFVGSAAAGAFALDLSRTARLVGFSALVGTPVAFVWFNLLDQYVMPTDPTSVAAVFSKVALDQVLMAPCMTSVFFGVMAMLEGSKRQEAMEIVKSKLKPTLLANWTVWPLAHVINFALVPPAQRILYINVINIAWTAFMSHMASSTGEQGEESKESVQAVARSQQPQQQSSR